MQNSAADQIEAMKEKPADTLQHKIYKFGRDFINNVSSERAGGTCGAPACLPLHARMPHLPPL